MQTFFCRLIPPRPDFAMTLSVEEREIMGAHAAYLRSLIPSGNAVVFGPVADPAGPWGLGVLRAADRAALDALLADDPVIASGIGARYEVLPMLQAVATAIRYRSTIRSAPSRGATRWR